MHSKCTGAQSRDGRDHYRDVLTGRCSTHAHPSHPQPAVQLLEVVRSPCVSPQNPQKDTGDMQAAGCGFLQVIGVVVVVGGWKFKHPSTQLLAVREDWGMACCLTAFLFFLAKLVSSCRLFLCFLQPQPRRTQSCRSTILGASLDVTLSDSRG